MILINKIMTPDGTILESKHRHDFVSHDDKNGTMYYVDGGVDYLRRGGRDDYTELSLTTDDDHERIREKFEWGANGINGDEPIQWIKLRLLSDSHIYAIMSKFPLVPEIKKVFSDELDYRATHGVA